MKNQQKLLGGLILGIAVGILLAPSSGEKTRKKIIDGSVGLKNDLMTSVNDAIESLRKQFVSKIDQLARGGKEAVNQASENTKV
jgi:gas vesicle protein